MTTTAPTAKYLKDYQTPDYLFETTDLVFDLCTQKTTVETCIKVKRNGEHNNALVLDGNSLQLDSVSVNGVAVLAEDYDCTPDLLTIRNLPSEFTLKTMVTIDPANNKSLEGLYKTDGAYCTQCEAEGFRRITYFQDRPDVLCKYTTKIIANKAQNPVLLSNGNKIDGGDLEDGKHWVLWQDPFNKPSYLFALVAGDYDLLSDTFTTVSGREVELELFVDKGNLDKAPHAMESLKKAMKWDEDTFGLEYDLDIYMIVATDFFNMGAMENKGLNVFNSKYVLANNATATDTDYHQIEAVIGHEYFHNWTGNRVTCRDWFQLSLKEGLTVFRDQQFSSDMGSVVTNRIDAVKTIRTNQFAEDAGPMAHPIRPEKVIEMNNFYTVTVYNKGAEVIRMMHSLLGAQNFRKGMDLYFERHDGTAVTCDDFVKSMEDASGVSLVQFRRWYSQSGTPVLKVNTEFNADNSTFTLSVSQINGETADKSAKLPFHIPFAVELLGSEGNSIPLSIDGQAANSVLDVCEQENQFVFEGVTEAPVPVLLLNFSAPVKVDYTYEDSSLLHIIKYAASDFSRWDAAQSLFLNKINQYIADRDGFSLGDDFVQTYKSLLTNDQLDKALIAELLTVPAFENVAGNFKVVDVDGINDARSAIAKALGESLYSELMSCYKANVVDAYELTQLGVAQRALKNACLSLLAYCQQGNEKEQVNSVMSAQFEQSDNMTDSLAVLSACNKACHSEFFTYMDAFEQKWTSDALVMDKWFALHACWPKSDVFLTIEELAEHTVFNIENPNRVRSLFGSFVMGNSHQFHDISGKGYRLLADLLIKLNSINPQTASRLITPLMSFKRYDATRQQLMREQLERVAALPDLSPDLFEKVTSSLK